MLGFQKVEMNNKNDKYLELEAILNNLSKSGSDVLEIGSNGKPGYLENRKDLKHCEKQIFCRIRWNRLYIQCRDHSLRRLQFRFSIFNSHRLLR